MACRPYNTGRCLLLRLFNPSKLWGSLQGPSLGFSSNNVEICRKCTDNISYLGAHTKNDRKRKKIFVFFCYFLIILLFLQQDFLTTI